MRTSSAGAWRSRCCRASILFLPAAASAGAAPVPDWLLGAWTPEQIYQDGTIPFAAGHDPKHWYAGSTLRITREQASFYEDTCQGLHASVAQAPVDVPVRAATGASLADFGLQPETGAVTYVELACGRSLVDSASHPGLPSDRGVTLKWYVIMRSPTEIDLPFFGHALVRLRKRAAGS